MESNYYLKIYTKNHSNNVKFIEIIDVLNNTIYSLRKGNIESELFLHSKQFYKNMINNHIPINQVTFKTLISKEFILPQHVINTDLMKYLKLDEWII